MIKLDQVYKSYRTRHGRIKIFEDLNFTINKGEKIGILGKNGAGKSTLIRLLSGAERPTKGKITRRMSVSWPIAFGGAFQSSLTGMDNIRFICRVYGRGSDHARDYVDSIAELGRFLDEPVRTYSSGMRARLAFALSMIVEFDCFLIDEVVAVGDARFHQKCEQELFVNRSDRAMVIVSHNTAYVKSHCNIGAILSGGTLKIYGNVDDAIHSYESENSYMGGQ